MATSRSPRGGAAPSESGAGARPTLPAVHLRSPDSQAGGGGHSSAGVHPVCSLVPTSAFAVLIDGLELVLTPLVLFALTVSN